MKGVRIHDHDDPKKYFYANRSLIWSIVIGNLQADKMKYYWTMDEVFDKLCD